MIKRRSLAAACPVSNDYSDGSIISNELIGRLSHTDERQAQHCLAAKGWLAIIWAESGSDEERPTVALQRPQWFHNTVDIEQSPTPWKPNKNYLKF